MLPTHVKDPVLHVRVWWIMTHQHNPACTKSVRIFKMLNGENTTWKKIAIIINHSKYLFGVALALLNGDELPPLILQSQTPLLALLAQVCDRLFKHVHLQHRTGCLNTFTCNTGLAV